MAKKAASKSGSKIKVITKASTKTRAKRGRTQRQTSSRRGQPPRRERTPVIDFHAHFMTEEVFEATYKLSVIGRLRAQSDAKAVRPLPEAQIRRMTDLDLRLEAMDEMGVDIQVISPNILHQCTYALDPKKACGSSGSTTITPRSWSRRNRTA